MTVQFNQISGYRPNPTLNEGASLTVEKVSAFALMAFAAIASFVLLPIELAILISGGCAALSLLTCSICEEDNWFLKIALQVIRAAGNRESLPGDHLREMGEWDHVRVRDRREQHVAVGQGHHAAFVQAPRVVREEPLFHPVDGPRAAVGHGHQAAFVQAPRVVREEPLFHPVDGPRAAVGHGHEGMQMPFHLQEMNHPPQQHGARAPVGHDHQ